MHPTHRKLIIPAALVFGLLCIFATNFMYHCIPWVLGFGMILSGIGLIVRGIREKDYISEETHTIAWGGLIALSGVVSVVLHENAIGLIGVSWGMFGLYRATREINTAMVRFFTHAQHPWQLLISGILGSAVAILLLIDPADKVHEHMIIIGIESVYIGLDLLVNTILKDE